MIRYCSLLKVFDAFPCKIGDPHVFSCSGIKVTDGFMTTLNYFRANFFSQVNLYRSEQAVYKVFILQDLLITFSLKYGKSFPFAHHCIFLKSNEVLPGSC